VFYYTLEGGGGSQVATGGIKRIWEKVVEEEGRGETEREREAEGEGNGERK